MFRWRRSKRPRYDALLPTSLGKWDNTDAIARLPIQYGSSYLYPTISMGARVSAVPNHQMGRITPLETRGDVAMMGNLGYELDFDELDSGRKSCHCYTNRSL